MRLLFICCRVLEREDHCLFSNPVVEIHTVVNGGLRCICSIILALVRAHHPAQHALCIVIGSLATAVGSANGEGAKVAR
jgi:hypothetical protein